MNTETYRVTFSYSTPHTEQVMVRSADQLSGLLAALADTDADVDIPAPGTTLTARI